MLTSPNGKTQFYQAQTSELYIEMTQYPPFHMLMCSDSTTLELKSISMNAHPPPMLLIHMTKMILQSLILWLLMTTKDISVFTIALLLQAPPLAKSLSNEDDWFYLNPIQINDI